jgi:cell division protein FtsW (lipid II flippase)
MRALAIVAWVIAAIAALGLHVLASWDLYLTGFPDGHLTDYDKAAEAPKRILMWVELGFVPLFLVLAFSPIGTRARAVGPVVALIVLALVVVVQLVGVPWYLGRHLGLDNGIGG